MAFMILDVFKDERGVTTTGMVAVIPWLPEPELVMAGSGAPPMRASEAPAVFMIIMSCRALLRNPVWISDFIV